MFCRSLFVIFLLAIVLYGLLRFTDSDYPFGIFNLYLSIQILYHPKLPFTSKKQDEMWANAHLWYSRKQEVGMWRVQKRFPRYGVPIWSLWPNIRFLPSIVAEKNVTKYILGQMEGRTEVKQHTPFRWSGGIIKQYIPPLVERGYKNTGIWE